MRRNMETLSIGHTLKSRIYSSRALELGADSAQCLLKVLVERSGLHLRPFFPIGRCRCRLSALVTVGHDLIAPYEVLMDCAFCETDQSRSTAHHRSLRPSSIVS